jgi:hypothetical protein
MAQLLVVAGATGLALWLAVVLLLPRRTTRMSSHTEPVPHDPSREEDRFRPAVSVSGERIWLDAEQLIWHEIVARPKLKRSARRVDVRRSA